MKKIIFIPAKTSLISNRKLKVTAYCRVSTELFLVLYIKHIAGKLKLLLTAATRCSDIMNINLTDRKMIKIPCANSVGMSFGDDLHRDRHLVAFDK